jgi:hypothetical protein
VTYALLVFKIAVSDFTPFYFQMKKRNSTMYPSPLKQREELLSV